MAIYVTLKSFVVDVEILFIVKTGVGATCDHLVRTCHAWRVANGRADVPPQWRISFFCINFGAAWKQLQHPSEHIPLGWTLCTKFVLRMQYEYECAFQHRTYCEKDWNCTRYFEHIYWGECTDSAHVGGFTHFDLMHSSKHMPYWLTHHWYLSIKAHLSIDHNTSTIVILLVISNTDSTRWHWCVPSSLHLSRQPPLP